MATIKVNGLKVHVQQLNPKGSETIILIPGLLGNLAQWYFNFAPILAKKYHVVMYDLKSHGKSEKGKSGFDLSNMATDLLGLMNQLHIEKTHIVGYSFGAQIAIKFAIEYGDRCGQIAILEAPSPKHSMVYEVMREHNLKTLDEVKKQLPSIVIDKVKNQFSEDQKTSKGAKRILKSTMKVFQHLCWETTLINDLDQEQDFEEEDLHNIAANTLLLYGTDSDCLEESNKLNKWIPSTHYILKKGGHWYTLENPIEVAEDVTHFFNTSEHNIFFN